MIIEYIIVPPVIAIVNRTWRGEGLLPRWCWYMLMMVYAIVTTHADVIHAFLLLYWLIFLLGYALMPWQAMFPAITGAPPGRKDSWYINWLQTITYFICNHTVKTYNDNKYWHRFGIIYGALRGAFMVPGAVLISYFYHSNLPLVGCAGVLLGLVYYLAGVISRRVNLTQNSVMYAELFCGYFIGIYMLLCGGIPS